MSLTPDCLRTCFTQTPRLGDNAGSLAVILSSPPTLQHPPHASISSSAQATCHTRQYSDKAIKPSGVIFKCNGLRPSLPMRRMGHFHSPRHSVEDTVLSDSSWSYVHCSAVLACDSAPKCHASSKV